MHELVYFARTNRLAVAGALMLLAILVGIAVVPLWLAYGPNTLAVSERFVAPDARHWLGTDLFGRDVLSRLLYGGRYTLAVGCAVVALAFTVGATFGTLSGYCGGWVDALMMRLVDALLSFPSLVLAIALAACLGPSLVNAMLAVAISLAPGFARVARGQALSISARPYVDAAISMGLPHPHILWHYVVRNGLGPLLVQASLAVGSAILQTASLGYLGLGAQAPQAEWGADLAANLQYLDRSPWIALAPGLAILATVLAFNLIGDALASWSNPKTRSSR
ncbi:ABC transporter permease [Pseudomonas sp. RIT-To-2]|uniref:ABC transporter permease n=1 Tax=Pseudomonas sp. RIT-To-2 TaxID=3462541 RepID=UPI002413C9A0